MSHLSHSAPGSIPRRVLPLLLLLVIGAVFAGASRPALADVDQAAEPEEMVREPLDAAADGRSLDAGSSDGDSPGADSTAPLRIVGVEIGLGGAWKVGHWTPVRVTLRTAAAAVVGSLEVEVPDGDGFLVRYGRESGGTPFELPAGSSETFTTYAKIGRTRANMDIRVRLSGGGQVQRQVAAHELAMPLTSTRAWILQVGSSVDLDRVTRRRRSTASDDPFSNVVLQASSLPSEWFGYEGVDTLLLLTSHGDRLAEMSESQREALEQWVKLGGHLIISSGRNGPVLQSGQGALARLVPGRIEEAVEQRVAAGLEVFARAEQTLGSFTASRLDEPVGRIEAHMEGRSQARQAAIVRAARGLGQVVFLAFDVDQSPFTEWTGTDELLRNLLRRDVPGRDSAGRDEGSRRVTHFGYDELAGQLRSALDHFPATGAGSGVRLISFFAVATLLACYVLAVSAGDYFLLQRLVGRMTWTWATFPLLVIAFSAAIVYWGGSWRGGTRLLTNQVDVVDVDLVNGTWRGTSWIHLYGPVTRGHDLSIEPVVPGGTFGDSLGSFRAIASWQGLPGRGLGGLDQVGGEIQFPVVYSTRGDAPLTAETLIEGMPITAGSTRSLLARWWSFPALPAVEPLSADRDGFLHGAITNPFDFPIEDALLAYDRWTYRIDKPLQPGETVVIDRLQRRDLEWRLTGRRALQGQSAYASTPWETDSRDVERIMEMMMFHEAAGGRGYTDLHQRFQQFVDLSGHLMMHRAVLVGRSPVPGMRLKAGDVSLTDEADRRWAWYRLVLPVESTDTTFTERYVP